MKDSLLKQRVDHRRTVPEHASDGGRQNYQDLLDRES